MLIDPIKLSQFMALPGAAELVEAFAALPPGEVRDSAVSHVQVLARACGWEAPIPFDGRMGREAVTLVRAEPARLPSPFAANLVAASVEGQIVERILRGEHPSAVADDLGLRLGIVTQAMGKARREGGVVFPGDGEAPKAGRVRKSQAKKAGKRGYSKHGRRLPDMMPVPPGPWWWEDAASPVWDNPRLLPSNSERAEGSMAGIGPHDTRSFSTMTKAAERRGLTLRQYIAERLEIVRRVEAGQKVSAISIDMRVTGFNVYGLLEKVGLGRMKAAVAAQRVAEAAEYIPAAEPPPEPQSPPTASPAAPEPVQMRAGRAVQHGPSALAMRTAAAQKWGFPDVVTYEHARGRVRELRLHGVAPAHIGNLIGQPYRFVKNALDYWAREGVRFPPIDVHAHERQIGTAAA